MRDELMQHDYGEMALYVIPFLCILVMVFWVSLSDFRKFLRFYRTELKSSPRSPAQSLLRLGKASGVGIYRLTLLETGMLIELVIIRHWGSILIPYYHLRPVVCDHDYTSNSQFYLEAKLCPGLLIFIGEENYSFVRARLPAEAWIPRGLPPNRCKSHKKTHKI